MPSAVSPFFQARGPPLPFTIPTCQTNLSHLAPRVSLIAQSILAPRLARRQNAIVRTAISSNPRALGPIARFPSPVARSPSPVARIPSSITRVPSPVAHASTSAVPFVPEPETLQRASSPSTSDSSLSDLTSLPDLPSNRATPAPDPNRPVPKPRGEAGRPNRGGYNLEIAIGWSSREFRTLKNRVHALCDEHLDTSKSIRFQSTNRLQMVRDEAMHCFPDLRRYEGCWPVEDLIQMHLKNTARAAVKRLNERQRGN